MTISRAFKLTVVCATFACAATPSLVLAQAPATPPAQAPAQAQPAQAQPAQAPSDPDLDPNPAQPDFTLITLPTTLRLPKFKSAFRVTHRFSRPLGQGDFSDLVEDFFGLDSGGLIGLEYRFGFWKGIQGGIHRTSDRTIEFFGRYNVLTQKPGMWISLDASASIDGTDNFSDSFTPSVGAVISHEFGTMGAIYVEPMWVNNSNPQPSELVDDNDTFVVGLGARFRVRPSIYLVGEFIPRSGYEPGVNLATFGIEKRKGGHIFQLNFSNGLGTTMGQVARGGTASDDWYIGFNITRKFF